MKLDDLPPIVLRRILGDVVSFTNIEDLRTAFSTCENCSSVLEAWDNSRSIRLSSFLDLTTLLELRSKSMEYNHLSPHGSSFRFDIAGELLMKSLWIKKPQILRAVEVFKGTIDCTSDICCELTFDTGDCLLKIRNTTVSLLCYEASLDLSP